MREDSNEDIRKIDPQKISLYQYSPYESSPWKFTPEKIAPWENYTQWNPLSTCKSYKWKKKQSYKIFCLEESCAVQHRY